MTRRKELPQCLGAPKVLGQKAQRPWPPSRVPCSGLRPACVSQAETEASSPQPPPPLPSAMQMSGEWEGGGGPGGKITQPWLTMTGWRKIASGSYNHILGVRTGMSVIKLNQKNRFNISATSHTT